MKITYKTLLIATIATLLAAGCKTSKNSAYEVKGDLKGKTSTSTTILNPPVNSSDVKELAKPAYTTDQTYFILQNEKDKFKDNSPFIEYLDGGKRERLWFSSSRADSLVFGLKQTNTYQQIYYCEREIGEGKAPSEGWGDVSVLKIRTDNPYFTEFIDKFNSSTKGAVAIANNTMIFSCDQIAKTGNSEFKNLWEMERKGDSFENPKPINELSNENTWESQPTLSTNGKHLFFVSNRKVEADGKTINNDVAGEELNIFYSFNENGKWRKAVVVTELFSEKNEVTPHICFDGSKLYFSSDKDGSYKIYEVKLQLDDVSGGYKINNGDVKLFANKTYDFTSKGTVEISVNSDHNQNYPFIYSNPLNRKTSRSIFWSADLPSGYGSFDIYGCAMPFEVDLNIVLVDKYPTTKPQPVDFPVIKIEGDRNETVEKNSASFKLYSGLEYRIWGGSFASQEKGTYICNEDRNYIFIGYSKIVGDPSIPSAHTRLINGAEVKSTLTETNGKLPIFNILSDTIVNDTVYITRAWMKKPPCPGKLNIEPTYRSISYFQTGYWEVNTSENLKRDLEKLHEGFDFTESGTIYNPKGRINRERSDYNVTGYEAPLFPVKTNDHFTYSIANASWIELHPNNQYWGDRPGKDSKAEQRMKGRKDRIDQYADYAKKVDENLKNLTDTIKNKYIHLLDLHKDMKPQLLIEIFAVSDQREVSRSWYIGDTVQYRGSEYDEVRKDFNTEPVKIIPPKVDEKTKTITQLKPCTVELNKDGDNGSVLGIGSGKTDQNTNLSRLRAWYGYKEVLKRLTDSETFNRYLKEGKVALPDNNVSYKDADIIIITRGKREDGDVENPKYPYPAANNPSGNGYFDYDGIRRIEIQSRLLFPEQKKKVEENYCCDPDETRK